MLALGFGIAAMAIATPSRADVLTYVGSTVDWFTASNWDLGRVPGPGDDVIIEDGHVVVIDPAVGSAQVVIRDLTIADDASLETLAGTEITSRNETVYDGGQLIYRATRAYEDAQGGTLAVLPPVTATGSGIGGTTFNPSTQSKRDLILKSSVNFGLGGTVPASVTGTGPGHYATVITDNADLGGTLNVALYYGFTPSSGQTFEIIDVGTRSINEFDGLSEGALVQVFGNVGLYISYVGGDGNDVVLTAVEMPRREGSITGGSQEDPFYLWTTEAIARFFFAM